MEISEIKEKSKWENFLLGCQEKTFLQSWNWGEFQKMTGQKIWRWGIYENGQLVALALVVKVTARRGNFLFIPHGPIFSNPNAKIQILNTLMEELKKLAKEEKIGFIRISPIEEKNEENAEIFKNLGLRPAPIHMHAETTWLLDIIPPEEQLLSEMRKTTRYLVRQQPKYPELKIRQSQDIADLKKFSNLCQETSRRQKFSQFSFDYLQNEFSAFAPDNQISLFLAEFNNEQDAQYIGRSARYNELLAGAMIVFWQGRAFYHHGASGAKMEKIPAAYILQWEIIKEAKSRGCKLYNFWGIAPLDNKGQIADNKHPWAGLTLFKMGFGGLKKEYLKTQDLPFSKSYWLTYAFEKLRKLKRGL